MAKILLKIGGMSCSGCSNTVEKYLNKQQGILSASVNLVMANALIEYDENILNQKKIEKFIKESGYESLGIDKGESKENNKHKKTNFISFAFLSVLILYISMGHMIGLPVISFVSMEDYPINYALCLLFLTIPFLIYGFDILKSGFRKLFHKSPNMDSLVTIGVLSSFLYSLFGTIIVLNGQNEYVNNLYFESSAIIIFFIKLGRYIDNISKDKTKEAIKSLVQITPKEAVIKINGKEKNVTIDEIETDDTVIARPGDKIAVDGIITFGKSHLDESFITGESKAVTKTVGDRVIAGSINYDGYLEYDALKIGKNSTISEIVRIVMEATSSKPPIARIADKISGYFVPTIIFIAIITFIVYLLLGFSFTDALTTFVTVLVVACPCSLGLATPLAVVISEGKCAQNGILVKNSEVLENASKIDTVVFDKTGTLTYGTLEIAKVFNYSDMTENELLKLVANIEQKSAHPIARVFEKYVDKSVEVTDFEDISGKGVKGVIGDNEVYLGSNKIISYLNLDNNHLLDENVLANDGNSIVYVVKNKHIIGLIGVNDIVRENASNVIYKLKQKGIETIILTGDNETTAKKVADILNIDKVIAGVLPTEKGKIIKELQEHGKKVMMVGDGINDSPALAISDIGVGVNSGTDIALDSSEVILMKNDLSKILDLIYISKQAVKNIKQNLFWAFFYNTLMIPIAIGMLKFIGVYISPMIAALAMTLSSLTVILNALRLKIK